MQGKQRKADALDATRIPARIDCIFYGECKVREEDLAGRRFQYECFHSTIGGALLTSFLRHLRIELLTVCHIHNKAERLAGPQFRVLVHR